MATISYLEYSNRDLKYAKDMFSMSNYDPCGRFCQQSVEKRFKYYIEHYGNGTDKFILVSHNLSKLYARVCELASISKDRVVVHEMLMLNSYYFDTNYPVKDGNIELTKEMAQEALEIAEKTNNWVDGLLSSSAN